MVELIYKKEVYEIVSAAIEVHKEMGNGFLEAFYQEALELELQERKIPFESQKQFRYLLQRQEIRK